MQALSRFARRCLHLRPEQVQVFTPTPSTYSTLMYHTGRHPFTGETLAVVRTAGAKERQKRIVTAGGRSRSGGAFR